MVFLPCSQPQRTYTGPDAGVGAHYAWDGNRKAGRGITSSDGEIGIRSAFEKPSEATDQTTFELNPVEGGIEVVRRMTDARQGVIGAIAKVLPFDNMIGNDFEKSLDHSKAAAESN